MTGFAGIHQFHPSTAVGDAITGDMLEIQRALCSAGFRSEILTHHVASGLEGKVRPLSDYAPDEDSLLIVHHSMGFDGFNDVVGLDCRKILRYHNITPNHLLPNLHLQRYAELGRRQLREYAKYVELAMGVSEFNRQELAGMGYRYTFSIPLFFRPETLLAEKPDRRLQSSLGSTDNLLFVGRICPNKKQDDLIRIFEAYYRQRSDARLLLVGSWEGSEEYAQHLRSEIHTRNLEEAVWLPGKISATELAACYRSSSALICASEHEGFCVPLLEAMAFDLPVVAYRAAAVPETLGSAGILLDTKDSEIWSEVIRELRVNPRFRDSVLQGQRKRLAEFHVDHSRTRLLEIVEGLAAQPIRIDKPILQIQGPFETSYSLAVINRNLALALDQAGNFDVSIYCTEGPGDYAPKGEDLTDKREARWLWQKAGMLSAQPNIVIRNLYPPRVCDMQGELRLLYFFWEDSLIRKDWAEMFNRCLDAVLVPSHHVEQVLRNSGVTLPTVLLHPGVDEQFFKMSATPSAKKSANSFHFLHISSGFPRKGIDLLLEAFFTEFTGADNVVLTLKTFPNIHNDIAEQLASWQSKVPNPPRCIHINNDLEQRSLEQLYEQSDCAVYPSRAEGFGLPIAEAMAKCVPVITTAYGGQMDFCTAENCFLLDFRLGPSRSHLNVPGSLWAEPHVEQLRSYMRFIVANRNSNGVAARVEKAFHKINEEFRWPVTANEMARLWKDVGWGQERRSRVAMVTSWDSRCGIAEYTRYLLEAVWQKRVPLDFHVLSSPGQGIWRKQAATTKVCWTGLDDDLQALRHELMGGGFDAVHFQFNFGFFALQPFAAILRELKRSGTGVLITFHATADSRFNGKPLSLRQISETLQDVDLILVHSAADQKRLSEMGIIDNVRVIRHGNIAFPEEDREIRRDLGIKFDPVIGTFGFLLPHKGILELLQALRVLRQEFPEIGLLAQCALHHDPVSREFENTVKNAISDLGLSSAVLLSTEFLSPEEAVLLLQMTDVMVLPYAQTAESSSAAVRFAIAAGRPIITTEQEIFEDVRPAAYQICDNDPERIATAIRSLITDSSLAARLTDTVRQFADTASWPRVADDYIGQLEKLLQHRRTGTPLEDSANRQSMQKIS